MKLPVKLAIFRILNYLHAAGAIGVLGLFIYEFDNMIFDSGIAVLLFILFILGFLVVITNAGINLLLLERYYPATMPGKKLSLWGNFLFGGTILFCVILSILFTLSIYSFYIRRGQLMTVDVLATAFIGVMLVSAIPVLWWQVSLQKTIRGNYENDIERFLQKEND